MSRKMIFNCDGCDETAFTGPGEKPRGWGCVRLSASGFAGCTRARPADLDTEYDLCEACQARMHEAMHPKRWARMKADVVDERPGEAA